MKRQIAAQIWARSWFVLPCIFLILFAPIKAMAYQSIEVSVDQPQVIAVDYELDNGRSSITQDKAFLWLRVWNLTGTWQEVLCSSLPKPFLLEPEGERLFSIQMPAATGYVSFETNWETPAAQLMFFTDTFTRLAFGTKLKAPTGYVRMHYIII